MTRDVLLVEGKAGTNASLARSLHHRGYAATLRNEHQALAWARQHQPDLIVLANSMTELSTADLCRSLKLHRSTNHLPLVRLRDPALRSSVLAVEVEADAESLSPSCCHELARAIDRALAAQEERQREGILAEVRFQVPSDSDHLEELNHLLQPWLASCGLGPFPVQQMNLAVREVAANAIEWGHRCQRDRLVSVACWLDADKVSVLVRDTGPGFDRRNLPHAAHPGDPLSHLEVRAARNLRDGGFGILMASGLVDHLCYNDAGNEAQLLKFLPRVRTPVSPVGSLAPLQP